MKGNNGSGLPRWDLLQAAEQQVGRPLPLQQLSALLELSELPEKGSYSQAEALQFLETCRQFAALGCDLEALKAARAAAAVAESVEEAAAKKFETLAGEVSLAAALMDEQIAAMVPDILEQQVNELLATPGLLEEIFREGARHIIAYEKAGYSESSQYQAWLDDKDKILRKIYRQLKLKEGWCYPWKK